MPVIQGIIENFFELLEIRQLIVVDYLFLCCCSLDLMFETYLLPFVEVVLAVVVCQCEVLLAKMSFVIWFFDFNKVIAF